MKRWQSFTACVLVMAAGAAIASGQTPPTPVPAMTAAQILSAAEDRAIREILDAARSDNPQFRSQAMEAIQPRPNRALPLAQIGLEDTNPGVRFAALITVGKLRLDGLSDSALRLQGDPDASVRAAAAFAAHASGRRPNVNEMPRLLSSEDPTVRANAAMVMGLMGDRSAVPMIREMAQSPMRRAAQARETLVRLQFAETLVELGEEQELEVIRAAMFSPEYEVRVLAVLALGRLGDQSMARAMIGFLRDTPVELRLASAQALAQMGIEAGRPAAMEAAGLDAAQVAEQAQAFIRRNRNDPLVPFYRQLIADPEAQRRTASLARAQACFTLAHLGGADAAQAIVNLLDDPEQGVRLAAAAATLRARR